jgi:hypothetical protein
MKFYDKGFVNIYDDYVHLQILNIGQIVLDLEIYEDKICKSTLKCMDSHDFNMKYLDKSYDDRFLYDLFRHNNIKFRDRKNNIFIKVIKD